MAKSEIKLDFLRELVKIHDDSYIYVDDIPTDYVQEFKLSEHVRGRIYVDEIGQLRADAYAWRLWMKQRFSDF